MIYHQTEGHFDITILPLLENNGYGISKEKISENI
jgi:thiamine biosynthesis lipoprotein ApbE